MKTRDKKISKKQVVAAGVAIATSASLVGANNFDASNNERSLESDHAEIIHISNKAKEKKTLIEKIPDILKCILYIPIWLIVNLVVKPVGKLIKDVILSPAIAFLLEWLLLFIILLLIILLMLKLIYPDKKIKDLLSKRLILGVGIASFFMKIGDLLLKARIEYYEYYKAGFYVISGLVILSLILIPQYIKKAKQPKLVYPKI